MSRIEQIKAFTLRKEEEKRAEDIKIINETTRLITAIQALKPRIDEIIEVGNACQKHNIPMHGKAWGGHEGYDTHQFYTNSWSHLVGFVGNPHFRTQPTITMLGINGGGANGKYDFRTDGMNVYEEHEDTKERILPTVYHMKKFLDKFDEFEREFYAYVDEVTQK